MNTPKRKPKPAAEDGAAPEPKEKKDKKPLLKRELSFKRKPKAPRAVGAAVGKNPISFVVPCHRVIGRSGELTGYHWGLTRKRAMLGWEAGKVAA